MVAVAVGIHLARRQASRPRVGRLQHLSPEPVVTGWKQHMRRGRRLSDGVRSGVKALGDEVAPEARVDGCALRGVD